MFWPFRSAQRRLDDDAADWLTKMRGPERERHREKFERWYRSSAAHAEAYEEAIAGFEDADVLRQGEIARGRVLPGARKQGVPLRYAFAAAAIVAAVVSAILLTSGRMIVPDEPGGQTAHYAAEGETRQIDLPDGSRMTLWGQSAAEVTFGEGERRITLLAGRGRFSVAHEARPFRVLAGKAEVLARGTLFDVSLARGSTRVSLIEGSVDVSYPVVTPGNAGRRVRRLEPGQQMVVANAPGSRAALVPVRRDEPAATMLQFDDTPLAAAVAQANRGSRTRIRLADPSIGELRVTGAFRSGDAAGLAESLAAAFGLHLEPRSDGTLVLHRNRAPARIP